MGKMPDEESVPQFLDRREAAEYIGLSDFWLAKHKADPDAPPYIKHGRKCWYRRIDLAMWVKERQERIENSDERLNDIWEQSSVRKTMMPSFKDLESKFSDKYGSETVAIVVAHTIERVRRLNPKKLKLIVNTLDAIEEGA